jgi:hypothetical protein
MGSTAEEWTEPGAAVVAEGLGLQGEREKGQWGRARKWRGDK